MKKSLNALLNALDKVGEDFEEVSDTDVRERMRDTVEKGLLDPVPGYRPPDEFGMFEPEGNTKVKAALAKFLAAAKAEAEDAGLKTRADRLRAFQAIDVESRTVTPTTSTSATTTVWSRPNQEMQQKAGREGILEFVAHPAPPLLSGLFGLRRHRDGEGNRR